MPATDTASRDPFAPPPFAAPPPLAPGFEPPFAPPVDETGPDPVLAEESLREREADVAEREDAIRKWVAAQREGVSKLTDRDVEGMIVSEYAMSGWDAFSKQDNMTPDAERALRCVTVVVLVLRNGFTVVGAGVCASPENYDATQGRAEAKADAVAKLWTCAEFAARQRLMGLDAIDLPDFLATPRPS